MPSLNNYRESHLQSAKNTLNDLLKRQDINNSTSTFSPVIQIPTAQISSDGGSFKHDTKVNQGIVNFVLIIGILMGITITTGIIIYTYIYRKRLMCKQSSSSNSNDRIMMVYNYYKGNQTDQSNVHPDAYNHQYDMNDEEYYYDNKKSHIIDFPGSGGSDMVKEKSVENISVSRSNTAKTNRSIKSTKSPGDKISPPHFSSPTKLPSVSVYDNERAKSLTWTETNRFQITRPAPPAPPIPALQTTKDKTKDLFRVPTIVYDDDDASSQYSDSAITKNPSDLHTKPRPSTSPSLSTSSNSSPSRSYNRESDIYSIYNCYSPTRSSEIKGSIHLPEVRLTTQRSGINVDGLFSGQSELNLEPLSNFPESQVNDKETAQGGDYYPKESGPNYTTTYYL